MDTFELDVVKHGKSDRKLTQNKITADHSFGQKVLEPMVVGEAVSFKFIDNRLLDAQTFQCLARNESKRNSNF